jgi:chemotaxis receptor (MCP) glutamine deamidase CheD
MVMAETMVRMGELAVLETLRIPVVATATGGNRGRTIRVDVASSGVTVREAGGTGAELVEGLS